MMLCLNNETFIEMKLRVERLYRRYRSYTGLTPDQAASKVLDDLYNQFDENPVTEIAALAALADICKDNAAVLGYLRREYETWNEYFEFTTDGLEKTNLEQLHFLTEGPNPRRVAV